MGEDSLFKRYNQTINQYCCFCAYHVYFDESLAKSDVTRESEIFSGKDHLQLGQYRVLRHGVETKRRK